MKTKHLLPAVATACLFGIAAFFVTSCNREVEKNTPPIQNASHKETPDNNILSKAAGTVGYLDEGQHFVPVPEEALQDFYRYFLGLPNDMVLEDHTIMEQLNPETGDYVYSVRMLSADQTERISTGVTPHDGGYALNAATATTTCECKTKACSSSFGCTAQIWNSNCSCSPCDGDCEKKSTTTASMAVRQFFVQWFSAHM